jgi:hypothetical protein
MNAFTKQNGDYIVLKHEQTTNFQCTVMMPVLVAARLGKRIRVSNVILFRFPRKSSTFVPAPEVEDVQAADLFPCGKECDFVTVPEV